MSTIGRWQVHPAADLMPLIEGAEFEALCRSFLERGYDPAHPIVLNQGMVIDGRNRLKACLKARVEPIFAEWKGEDPYEYVWIHSAVRRHLEPGQRVALRLKFDEEIAKLKQIAHVNANKARSEAARAGKVGRAASKTVQSVTTVSPTKPAGESGKTRGELAKRAEVGVVTAQKAITVQAKAPELFEQVAQGEISLSAAHRKVQRDAAIEQLRAEPTPLPDGQFRVIVADPPWPYEVRNDDASHRGAIPYHAMSLDEITLLPVFERSHEDSILWLWTTNAFLEEAYGVLRAWGFQPKTVLTWDKGRVGTGNWLRNQTEHCIVAVRGKPTVNLTNQSTLLQAPPSRQHSAKPDEFYALVESLCPGSKLELFARKARPGWTAWGSEVEGIVQRDEVQAPEVVVERDPDVDALGVPGEMLIDERGMSDNEWMGRPAGGGAER